MDAPPPPPPLAYAMPESVDVRLGRARRAFAGFTLVYAVCTILQSLYMAHRWSQFTAPGWRPFFPLLASALLAWPLIAGAVLALKSRDAGMLAIRWTALALCAVNFTSNVVLQAGTLLNSRPNGMSDALVIGTLAYNLLGTLIGVPVLLFWLSFPLRRGVR